MPSERLVRKVLQEKVCQKKAGTKTTVQALLTDLKACSRVQDLQKGKQLHAAAVECGHDSNLHVLSGLVRMYAKCSSIIDARRVFDGIKKPDVASWTALLMGYATNGEGIVALDLFSRMKASGCMPDPLTYVAVLKACTSLAVDGDATGKKRCLERGREIHLEIGSNLDLYVESALVDMYAKCGCIAEARGVFDRIQKPDVVAWTALLMGYAENGEGLVALDLFSRMRATGCVPNYITYVAALKACTSLTVNEDASGKRTCLERGRGIHSEIGSNLNLFVQSVLIDMYAKSDSMVDARRVFDSVKKPDVVCWNALLLGYAENGEGLVALDLFSQMKASRCAPDALTYVAAIKACGLTGDLALGRKLHSEITEFSVHVVTSLVDFYGKCGSMGEAHDVFDLYPNARDTALWNALLAGYGRFGDSHSVFDLFEAMQDQGIRPDAVTFVCVLSCCSHAGLVEKAREYFEAMEVRYKVAPTVVHYNCMVDVLGRANLLNEAVDLLHKMPCNPDVVTWMGLLGACHKWKNVEIGRRAFQSLMGKNEKVATAHVLMAHIYGTNGMQIKQERVLETRTGAASLGKLVLNEVLGKMVKFVAGEQGPTEVEERMRELCKATKKT